MFQGDSIYWVEVEKIVPNPYQPRRDFDESKLQELAESVRMYGVLQPLTVTRKEVSREDGTFFTEYELIAGERRLRASRIAALAQVPVIIRSGEQTDQEKLELAIIENLQREDLNAVDRAIAFRQLADQFSLSHSQVAKKVGRSREYVSNTLRLLALPEYMLASLKGGDISEGHARTLLMLNDRPEEQDTVFRETLLKKLSVRELERISRKIATDRVRKKDWGVDPVIIEIEKRFTDRLGTRVQIQKTDFGGKLTIDYFTNDDLEKLLEIVEHQENAIREQHEGLPAEEELTDRTPLSFADAPNPAEEYTAPETDPVTEHANFNDRHEPQISPTPNPDATEREETRQSFAEESHNNSLTEQTPAPASQSEPSMYEVTKSSLDRFKPHGDQVETSVYEAPPVPSESAFSPEAPSPQNPHATPIPSESSDDAEVTIPDSFPSQSEELNTENNEKRPEREPERTDDSDLYSIRSFTL